MPWKKSPVTPPGIDPGTFWLVAQCLNHYATPGPSVNQCWKEMAASPTEYSWCVQEFVRCNSFVVVERAFGRQFGRGHYMKLQTFLFQMVVKSCISVRYLRKYGFEKYSRLFIHTLYFNFCHCMISCIRLLTVSTVAVTPCNVAAVTTGCDTL
jgi:hypothetical protein